MVRIFQAFDLFATAGFHWSQVIAAQCWPMAALRMSLDDVPGWFTVLLLVWLFLVGASLGSFLNVVVYRAPLGLSVSHPPSRCPRCFADIAWHDNIPVLSWMLLGGRCRGCDTRISSRYPLIEAVCGGLYLCFGWVEGFNDGVNLPSAGGPAFSLITVWATYICHMGMLTTLICAALMVYDGHRIPPRVFVIPTLLLLLLSAIVPGVHPVGLVMRTEFPPMLAGLCDASFGLAAGVLLGQVAGWGLGVKSGGSPVGLFALCGTVLGWQAVLLISAGSLWLWLILRFVSSCRYKPPQADSVPWPLVPLLLASLFILAWRPLAEMFPWLGPW